MQEGGLALDLMMSIKSDAMLDVVLLSNDGSAVPASRFVLGARSPILQKMLFPNILPSPSKLKLDYCSNVVNTLVNYCRTNELRRIAWQSRDEASSRELVQLCHCAVTYQLKGLQDLVEQLVFSIVEANPHLACAIYDEAAISGKPVGSIKQIALNLIRQNPEEALLCKSEFGSFGGVSSLGSETLEELLSDSQLCTEEINLFRAVTQWTDAFSVSEYTKQKRKDAWATQLSLQRRRMAAKKIIENCIDLFKIAPSDLMGTVSESGLVDEVKVSNAIVQIALRFEKEGFQVSKSRCIVMKERLPPQPPPPIPQEPSQTLHGLKDNSAIVDIYVDLSEAGSCHSYETVQQNNKRRPTKQQPKAVTPEKKKRAPRFVYQDTNNSTNSSCCVDPKYRLGDSSATTNDISKFSLYLQDKVDSMCVHPGADSAS